MKKMSRRVTSDVEKKFRLIIKARGERCYSLLAARSGPVWKGKRLLNLYWRFDSVFSVS